MEESAGPNEPLKVDSEKNVSHQGHIAWLGTTLRLEACGRRLELRPTATGIIVVYLEHLSAPSRWTCQETPRNWCEAGWAKRERAR